MVSNIQLFLINTIVLNFLLQELKVEVATFTGHTLYNPEAIIAKNQGAVPLTYQKLQVDECIVHGTRI